MSTVIKFSKAQISKTIQSGGSLGSWLGNLGKKALINDATPFIRYNLPGLVNNITSTTINKFEREMSRKEPARPGKGLTLSISNEDMNDITKTIK